MAVRTSVGDDRADAFFGAEHITVIEPRSGLLDVNLRELWAYRELLGLLIWRDIAIRYKQTLVGVGWAVIQPVTTMLIFTIIFGRLAGLPSDDLPYPIFAFCGLLPWNYFARSLSDSSDSLVSSANLVTKVYFPRLLLPLSKVFAGLVDLAIASVILLLLMFWYGIFPDRHILFAPVFLLLAMITSLGVGLWLTALNVRYRDVRFVVPFLVQIWMYVSPVAYSTNLFPEQWRWLYGLNPMVGVIEGFRWSLLGSKGPDALPMLMSMVAVGVVLLSGIVFFRRQEKAFADII